MSKNSGAVKGGKPRTALMGLIALSVAGAISMTDDRFDDFQYGMALATKIVLDTFKPENVYFINLLAAITILCDCWGLTTPSVVPDIGIMASNDIVAVEKASLDAIKIEDFIQAGVPVDMKLGESGHLFERIHGKDPFIQIRELEGFGLGRWNTALKLLSKKLEV